MSRSPRIRDHELGVTSIQTQSPGFLRSDRHLSFTHCWYDISRMGGDIDPQNQAEAAMKEAVNPMVSNGSVGFRSRRPGSSSLGRQRVGTVVDERRARTFIMAAALTLLPNPVLSSPARSPGASR